jgi:hypothetical protein
MLGKQALHKSHKKADKFVHYYLICYPSISCTHRIENILHRESDFRIYMNISANIDLNSCVSCEKNGAC